MSHSSRNSNRTPCVPRRRAALATAVLSAGIAGAALIGQASAAPETYAIDPDHSAVTFTIRHLFSKVPGRFTKFEGSLTIDKADPAKSAVNATIDAGSIDTDEAKRDGHLKSPDFFDAAKYPTLTFKSTAVKVVSPEKLQITGDLTIRGKTKPAVLDVDLLGFGPGFGGGFKGGFEGHTRINRQDFGVAWNSLVEGGGAVLGDDVDITLNIEATRVEPKPAAKKN